MNPIRPFRIGILLSLFTLLFGFGLGIFFGAAEDRMKAGLKRSGEAALESVYDGDKAAMEKVVAKSWVYYKRAHLHANGLGTTSLAIILLLALLPAGLTRCRVWTATASGLGALGYSIYWLLAGMRAPSIGSTHDAKESLDWLAIPSSGLCLLGLIAAVVIVAIALFRKDAAEPE